jgi:hypothetical protein
MSRKSLQIDEMIKRRCYTGTMIKCHGIIYSAKVQISESTSNNFMIYLIQERNPLDPFLSKLCREYSDDENLVLMLNRYFQVMLFFFVFFSS